MINRKYPSGAQKRKARQDEEERMRAEDRARRASSDPDALVAGYRDIGPPPEDDVLGSVGWAVRILTQTIHEVANDKFMLSERRWRLLGDLTGKVGLLHSKARLSERISKAVRVVEVKKDSGPQVESLAGILKPQR